MNHQVEIAAPESFSKINSLYHSTAIMAANLLGPKLGGPTTKDIANGNLFRY